MPGTKTAAHQTTLTKVGDRELRIERIFDAPRAKVWRAYTDPALLVRWWGRGNKCDLETFEPIKGGHWRLVEHSPEGSHGFEGRFRAVAPMERISRTFEWDGMPGYPLIQTAEFSDESDGRTKLVATVLFMTAEECAGMLATGMEGGMNESYAALDRLLESI